MSESEEEPVSKRRKGVVNEEKYKRSVIKTARVKGDAYVSYKGKQVSAKTQVLYHCKCADRCYADLTDEDKTQIWDYFYSLESKNVQDTYLQTLIEKRNPKRRRKGTVLGLNDDENEGQALIPELLLDEDDLPEPDIGLPTQANVRKEKHNFYIYNIKVRGELREVCKKAFMGLFGVTESVVRRIGNLLCDGKRPIDQRGKQMSGNAISGNVCVRINAHISRYDVKITHYGDKPKQYLDARLNVTMMYMNILFKTILT